MKKKDKKNVFVYKFEKNLYINLTNRCCNRCIFCLRKDGDTVNGEDVLWLSREPSAEDVVDGIKNCGFDYESCVFCGYGEPTYKMSELTAVADYIHGIGKTVRLNTNGLGSLINRRDIVPELKGRVDVVSLSLNESSSERYERLCNPIFCGEAFPALLEFAGKCVSAGIKTVMSVVDANGVDIEKCREIASSTGAELRVRELIK